MKARENVDVCGRVHVEHERAARGLEVVGLSNIRIDLDESIIVS